MQNLFYDSSPMSKQKPNIYLHAFYRLPINETGDSL